MLLDLVWINLNVCFDVHINNFLKNPPKNNHISTGVCKLPFTSVLPGDAGDIDTLLL